MELTEDKKSHSQSVELINPYTEKLSKEFKYQSAEELEEILEKSHHAYQEWKIEYISEKVKILQKLSKIIEDNRSELAKLITEEMGKTYKEANAEVDVVIEIIDYCVDKSPDFLEASKKDIDEGEAYTILEPQGIVLSIQPWNFPLYQVIRTAVPNLLLGNAMILSHAENVWGCAEKLTELINQTGIPDALFTSIYAKKEDLEIFYKHAAVRGITFTGSDETGRKVAKKAAANLKKTVLEMGGNDAYIILNDADLEKAVKACMLGRFSNSGQVCTAAKRFLVEEEVYDDFLQAYKNEVEKLKLGDPMEDETDIGPLARKDLLEKLDKQVQDSISQGAEAIIGGKPADMEKGYFYEPTILTELKSGMPAYDDELFGPVASVIKVKNADEAIKISNASRYGLGGGIFSQDEKRAMKIACKFLDTGMVNINGYSNAKPNLAFGGVKNSGYGREHERFGFEEFANIKVVRLHKQK